MLSQDPINIPHKAILSLFAAMVVLAPIAAFNRYVFLESNLPFLLIILVTAAIVFEHGRIPKGISFPIVASVFLLFILYAWFLLNDPWNVDVGGASQQVDRPGFLYILDLVIYYLLFVTAALLFYKRGKLWDFPWFLVCGYIVAFIIRNSFDIRGLQEGYNVSPGFVLVTLLPFAFLMHEDNSKTPLVATALLAICALWLALIGARTASAALLLFYALIWAWPLISRNRFIYYSIFWGAILSVALLIFLYLFYAISNPDSALLQESLVDDSEVGILQKRLGTRTEIWIHLLFYISQQPIFGYGTDQSTFIVSPVPTMKFTYARDNLSAHSTYFELLYRLGVIGLLAYIALLFSIWKAFWIGRKEWAVRVAGAFLICIIFFGITETFLVFSPLQLRSGFGWVILGIGAGACLRAMRSNRLSVSVNK